MIKRFFPFLGKYKGAAVLAIALVVLETALELVIPLLMAGIVDVGVATGDRAFILRQGLLMCACALAALALGMGHARLAARVGQGLGAALRQAEYAKIQSFSFANMDHFSTASLVTRLTSDVTAIQNLVSTGMRPFFRSPMMMLVSIFFSFCINPKLAVVFLVAAPLLGLLLYQIIRRVGPLYGRMQTALDSVNRIVRENLTAIRVVKAYARGDWETEKFNSISDDLRAAAKHSFSLSALNTPAMQLVLYATILCLLWLGGGLTQTGGLQVGELTGFLSYVMQVLNALMLLSNVFLLFTRSLASGKRILEVLDEAPDITETLARDVGVERGDIRFEHVFFKYSADAEEYVLSDINLDIKAGETVALLGETGAAKSTLVQLIARLYDVTDGVVFIDGRPVSHYPLDHLHDAVSMVLQKNTLFTGTIRENLLWGDENADEETLLAACLAACVDEFLERLEQGLDTRLGQGGVNVSGGQKQRLCIARAILKQPKILILDDSTSAVDTATEARLREGLRRALPETTKVLIAQRVSSVQHADQIVILSDGRIDAVGNHETLLQTNRIYQELYRSQQEGGAL